MSDLLCPLCDSKNTVFYYRDELRPYRQCSDCRLVFVPPQYHLSAVEEKKRYDKHRNHPADDNYRRFLSRLYEPLNEKLSPGSKGLDFGSGPGPTLHLMFEGAGHSMRFYDLFYAKDLSVFEDRYDFITASEVVEHLRCPRRELERLWGCLRRGGRLAIMTKRVTGREAFRTWHYIRDETHIAFFSEGTFSWLADYWSADVSFPGNDVAIFHKCGCESNAMGDNEF